MANESFANTPMVEVDGNPLAADVASLLVYAYVDDSRNIPDMFLLRFRDPQHIVLSKTGVKIGSKVTIKAQTAEPGGPKPLIIGEVTAVELALDTTGTMTEIRGLDRAHRLYHGRRTAAYPNMTLADVVRKVAQRAGLTAGTIDPVSGVGGQQDTQISQDNISDWEFLSRLADLVGAQLYVVDETLHFRLPAPPSGAPGTNAQATTDPLVLEAHRNLIALRARVGSVEQVPSVQAGGWDFEHKQEVTATATPAVAGTEAGGVDPPGFARKCGAPPLVIADPAWRAQAVTKAAATAVANQLGSAAVEIEGVAKGNPNLRAGTPVALANVGDPFTGKYTLTSTRHLFSEDAGYTTSFTVSGRLERSLYGLAGGGSGGGPDNVLSGLVPGIVSDVKDPSKLGRVKVTFPWLDKNFATGWARTVQPGAGKSRGAVVLPEVGDEVLVGFAHGDVDTPYVLGGMYNGKDTVPPLSVDPVDKSGAIAVRGFVSRKGHVIEMSEDGGILIATGDKKLSVKLDVKNSIIEIKADKGVTIDGGSGPVQIKGQDVTVTAKAKLDLSGNQGAMTGKSKLDLTSNSAVTVTGKPIKLN